MKKTEKNANLAVSYLDSKAIASAIEALNARLIKAQEAVFLALEIGVNPDPAQAVVDAIHLELSKLLALTDGAVVIPINRKAKASGEDAESRARKDRVNVWRQKHRAQLNRRAAREAREERARLDRSNEWRREYRARRKAEAEAATRARARKARQSRKAS